MSSVRNLLRCLVAALLVAGVAMISGCAGGEAREDHPPDAAHVNDALAFSGIAMPPGTRVLGVDGEHGLDQMYKLAVSVDAQAVDRMLTDSGLTVALVPGRQPSQPPVDGVALGSVVASASDELPPGPGRESTVFREILVDRTDPAKPVVHVWAHTT